MAWPIPLEAPVITATLFIQYSKKLNAQIMREKRESRKVIFGASLRVEH